MTKLIIDLSSYNLYNKYNVKTPINWTTVKQSNPDLCAIINKLGEGYWTGYPMSAVEEIYSGARNAGYPVAPYHFCHPEYPASTQGAYIKERYNMFEWQGPLIADIEDSSSAPVRPIYTYADALKYQSEIIKWTNFYKDYLKELDNICGRLSMVYSGAWFMDWLLFGATLLGIDISFIVNRPYHIASYTTVMKPIYGVPTNNNYIWQYTNKPNPPINGFPNPTALDMNKWLKSDEEFITFWGLTPIEYTDKQKLDLLWNEHPQLHI